MEKLKWVNGWGMAISHPPLNEAQWTNDTTVRYVIINSLDAKALKLKFSNRFGQNPATLSHVTVAKSVDSADKVDNNTITQVTFNGSKSGTMAPFGEIESDPIPFDVKCGEKIAVSIYFKDFTQLNTGITYDNQFFVKNFIEGDCTECSQFDTRKMAKCLSFSFLWSIDFLTYQDAYSIAAFGDSITTQEWVDIVANKLIQNNMSNRAIVRRAISGSRIFGQYDAVSYYHYGEDGKTRFEREIVHSGIQKVIILHGINDLIHPDGQNEFRPMSDLPTTEQMIEGLTYYINTAHKHNIKAYIATLLPFKGWRTYDKMRDDIRIEVNDWIRTQNIADGVIDFDKAVRDENDPLCYKEGYHRGDCLHASLKGYQAMSEIIDFKIFE